MTKRMVIVAGNIGVGETSLAGAGLGGRFDWSSDSE